MIQNNKVGLDRETFKRYMTTIINYENYIDKVSKLGINLWEVTELSELEMCYINLIDSCLNLESTDEYGSVISFFLFECDKGKADNSFIEVGGEKHYIRNIDELYDWIVFDKERMNY